MTWEPSGLGRPARHVLLRRRDAHAVAIGEIEVLEAARLREALVAAVARPGPFSDPAKPLLDQIGGGRAHDVVGRRREESQDAVAAPRDVGAARDRIVA